MPFDLDDPRLTAYALGEIDPADRDAIEAILRDEPDGRAFVAGVAETAALLLAEFRRESSATPGLDAARLGTIEARLAPPTLPIPAPPPKPRSRLLPIAAAAGLLGFGATLLYVRMRPAPAAPTQVALLDGATADHSTRMEADRVPILGPVPGEFAKVAPPPGPPGVFNGPGVYRALSIRAQKSAPDPAAPKPPAIAPGSFTVASSSPKAEPLDRKFGYVAGRSGGAPPSDDPNRLAKRDGEGAAPGRNRTVGLAPVPADFKETAGKKTAMAEADKAKSPPDAGGGFGGTVAVDALGRPGLRPSSSMRGEQAGNPGGRGTDQPGLTAQLGKPEGGNEKAPQSRAAALAQGQAGQDRGRGYGEMARADVQDRGQKGGGRAEAELERMAKSGQSTGLASSGPQSGGGGDAQPQPTEGKDAGQYARSAAPYGQKPGEAPAPPAAPAQEPGYYRTSAPAGDSAKPGEPAKPQKPEAKPQTRYSVDPFDAVEILEPAKKKAELVQLQDKADEDRRKAVREEARAGREAYARLYDNPFLVVQGNELSTFSVDVDTASYANVRRFLAQGQLPPVDAVRIEELVNYFTYDDPAPKGDAPFSVNVEVAACPWDGSHRLARIGLKGKAIDSDKRPTSNLVFLIDVSGSMGSLDKLPLLKAGMKLLVDQLTENDRVGIVVYANESRVVLPSTACHDRAPILAAIDGLQANGGTNGGAGIQLAYQMAQENFIKGGTNRVLLATDGDFNVGLSKEDLLATSAERAKTGVFLSVLGFGTGNIQEDFMEGLADKGNGNFSYIDTIAEARKVLVRQMSGTLVAIAKDVKVQLEFNPARVASYRLIGYENRVMPNEDFRDDKKDAGEIGAGHSVTALYEIVPVAPAGNAQVAERRLKYQQNRAAVQNAQGLGIDASPETMTVTLRYKRPDGEAATEIGRGVVDDGRDLGKASADLKFSAAVAGFGMLLRESPYRGTLSYPAVLEIAAGSLGPDRWGDRKAFLDLVRQAEQVQGPAPAR